MSNDLTPHEEQIAKRFVVSCLARLGFLLCGMIGQCCVPLALTTIGGGAAFLTQMASVLCFVAAENAAYQQGRAYEALAPVPQEKEE